MKNINIDHNIEIFDAFINLCKLHSFNNNNNIKFTHQFHHFWHS